MWNANIITFYLFFKVVISHGTKEKNGALSIFFFVHKYNNLDIWRLSN